MSVAAYTEIIKLLFQSVRCYYCRLQSRKLQPQFPLQIILIEKYARTSPGKFDRSVSSTSPKCQLSYPSFPLPPFPSTSVRRVVSILKRDPAAIYAAHVYFPISSGTPDCAPAIRLEHRGLRGMRGTGFFFFFFSESFASRYAGILLAREAPRVAESARVSSCSRVRENKGANRSSCSRDNDDNILARACVFLETCVP